ncbi:MAG: tetratricopeptide repeat protein [Planctomycetales bacterium]|nr:tetratricopeptide repeat protein [Planctomycetales bacterium]
MRRLNVKLIIGLLLALFLFVGAILGIHWFQTRSGGGAELIAQAETAKEEGRLEDSRKLYEQYLQRSMDDDEQFTAYALVSVDWLNKKLEDGEQFGPKEFQRVYQTLAMALRRTPDNLKLMEAGADFDLRFGRFQEAAKQYETLIDAYGEGNADKKLYDQLARSYAMSGDNTNAVRVLSVVTGYDIETGRFSRADAKAPENVEAYSMLAQMFRHRLDDPEKALAVLNRMVSENPQNAKAYLSRAQFLPALGDQYEETIQSDLDKALELAPGDETVIVQVVANLVRQKDFEKSRQLLERFLADHPDSIDAYVQFANWAILQNDAELAQEYVSRGLELDPKHQGMLWMKANIELTNKDYESLAKTKAELETLPNYPLAFIKFLTAREHLNREEWMEDLRADFRQLRPDWVNTIDMHLATCYERLNQPDRRLEVCRMILNSDPDNLAARWGEVQSLLSLRQIPRALQEYSTIEQMYDNVNDIPVAFLLSHLQLEVVRQTQRDEKEQNWRKAEDIVRRVADLDSISEVTKLTVLQNYFAAKGDEKGRERVERMMEEKHPNNANVRLDAIRRRAREDIDGAIKDLEDFVVDYEDSAAARLLRVDLLLVKSGENVKDQLIAQTDRMDSFNEKEKAALYDKVGTALVTIAEWDLARQMWMDAAALQPNNLQLRIRMFELGLLTGNTGAMESAINELEQSQGKDSAEWKWARAAYLTWQVQQDPEKLGQLQEAASLIEEAIRQRETWDSLYRLQGEIYLMQGEREQALDVLTKALEYGPEQSAVMRQVARLLYEAGRYRECIKMIERVPESKRSEEDVRTLMLAQGKEGELPEDIEFADDDASPIDLIFRAQILLAAGKTAKAEEVIRKALDMEPSLADGWKTLVRILVADGRIDEAKKAVKQAEIEVPEQQAPLLLGQCYEILRQWGDAEQHYRRYLDSNPNDPVALRSMATLYFLAGRLDVADSFLDRIIANQADDAGRRDAEIVRWARRLRAEILAQSQSYHDFAQALSVIEENVSSGGVMSSEDLQLWAGLSARRPDGFSRARAIDKMEEVQRSRNLSDRELLILADLYEKQDRWTECKSVMQALLTKNASDINMLGTWLSWLLKHDELGEAERYLRRAPENSSVYITTRAELLVRRGRIDDAKNLIRRLIPGELDSVANAKQIIQVAALVERLGQFDASLYPAAENMVRQYVKLVPHDSLVLAQYLGRRGEEKQLKEAFALCEPFVEQGKYDTGLQTAISIIRSNRQRLEKNAPYWTMTRKWFELAQKQVPDDMSLVLQRFEFENLANDFAAMEKWLRVYLDSPEINPRQRAGVSNNLAYILALQGKADEALKMVNDAITVLGPTGDLMDTRALAYIAKGDATAAIAELQQAMQDGGETPFKMFHLAQARFLSGERQEAEDALRQAIKTGLDPDSMNSIELQQFKQLADDLGVDASAVKTAST